MIKHLRFGKHSCRLFALAGCLLTLPSLQAQDIHFSQIQEAPLLLNPANTGFFNGSMRVIANYRNQWSSMDGAFKTMAVSLDANILRDRKKQSYLGLGLYVFNDKAGAADIANTQAMLTLSGIVRVSRTSRIGLGLYGGFSQNTGNYNKLSFGTQYNGSILDPTLPSQEIVTYGNFSYIDLGAGANYEYSNATADLTRKNIFSIRVGGAVYHINKPLESYSPRTTYVMPMRISGQVSSRIDIPETKFSFLPSLVYMRQGTASELVIGTHARYRFRAGTKFTGMRSEGGISLGAYWRMKDAVIPQLMVDMGNYAIGLSYDLNISSYRQASRYNGGYEISLKWTRLEDALFKQRR